MLDRFVALSPGVAHAGAADGPPRRGARARRRPPLGEAGRPHRPRRRGQQGAQARAPLRRRPRAGLRHARHRWRPAVQPRPHDRGGRQPPRPRRARSSSAPIRPTRRPATWCSTSCSAPTSCGRDRSSTTTSRPPSRPRPTGSATAGGGPTPCRSVERPRSASSATSAPRSSSASSSPTPPLIVTADGTGGTHAGLVAGWGDHDAVLGVDVGTRPDLDDVVPREAAAAAALAGLTAPTGTCRIDHDRFGDGYGAPTRELPRGARPRRPPRGAAARSGVLRQGDGRASSPRSARAASPPTARSCSSPPAGSPRCSRRATPTGSPRGRDRRGVPPSGHAAPPR